MLIYSNTACDALSLDITGYTAISIISSIHAWTGSDKLYSSQTSDDHLKRFSICQ